MDVYVTLTYRTCIPFDDIIDISEVNEHDALGQLSDEAQAELSDNWTLIAIDASTSLEV